jgi:hypothetical protein
MSKPLFTERLSFGMTPEMDRLLEDIARLRTRKGKPVSKADLLREAVRLYLDQQDDLHGSRKQMVKSLEGELEHQAAALQALTVQVQKLTQLTQAQAQELAGLKRGIQPLVDWVESWRPR